MIWAYLAHLSFNMWEEADAPPHGRGGKLGWVLNLRRARPGLRFDDAVWERLLHALQVAGANLVVLDLGDGVRYKSHPEIAVKGAWSRTRLQKELRRLRRLGLEPIPKLNFSTGHDTWLGPYARCVSTELYYQVCRDLIAEVCDLFQTPRFFHLGMDEESTENQRFYLYAVERQHTLWWHDLHFLAGECRRHGVRPWVWSDYGWEHLDAFRENMPEDVLQSNWYYGKNFTRAAFRREERRRGLPAGGLEKTEKQVRLYDQLDEAGFDQVPTASIGEWGAADNLNRTVAYCRKRLSPERLKGFMMAPWLPILPNCERRLVAAATRLGKVRQACSSGS